MGTYLLGTSNTTYPMKKTTREMEYSFDDRSKSVSMPDIFAFPILSAPSLAIMLPAPDQTGRHILGSIQVRQQIHEPHHRHQDQVNLSNESLFLLGRVERRLRAGILDLLGQGILLFMGHFGRQAIQNRREWKNYAPPTVDARWTASYVSFLYARCNLPLQLNRQPRISDPGTQRQGSGDSRDSASRGVMPFPACLAV